MMPREPKWMRKRMQLIRNRERNMVADFVNGVRDGDKHLMYVGIADLVKYADSALWCRALRQVAQLGPIQEASRLAFMEQWVECGDTLRAAVSNDLVLADALRHLLPPYCGPALRLYRGENFHNRRRRSYGFSWTSDEEVADGHAQSFHQTCEGGSVVLSAMVPAEAVICAPHLLQNRYAEDEYVVDRRLLSDVKVIRRYPQRPI
jgi:hypothetical protein